MKRSKGIIFLVFIFLILTGCNKKQYSNNKGENKVNKIVQEDKEVKKEDKIEKKIKWMTLEEKVGQLIIAGFEGTEISSNPIKLINEKKIGGFILFSRNIEDEEQTLKLLNNLKLENSNNSIPLFLSIDEEGGKVSRLPKSYKKISEAINFGEKGNNDVSYELGQVLGNRVKILGFNVNFAPVLDIYSNHKNTVIGSRAYGTTVEGVVNNGLEVMKGIRSTNIIPVIKHFPGHGDTSLDSHIELPKVNKTLDELESLELIPFDKAIEDDIEMVMVAHILYPEIDAYYPASMSSNIIQGILRDKMGYEGVVVSDDMTMGAIVENYNLEDGVLQFIKSGGDLALICHGQDNPILAIDKIINSVNEGEISEDEIDKKVYRVIKLKERYKIEDKIIETIDLEKINKGTEDLIEKISN